MKLETNRDKLNTLWNRPVNQKFTPEEIKFIKKFVPKSSYRVKYAIYKPVSIKDLYIGFFIDSDPNARRRSGILNHWNFLYERELTNIEYHEVIENYGSNNRRFLVYHYRHIEHLILEDLKYNVATPAGFVKECKRLGYTGNFQLIMEFLSNEEHKT